MGHIEGSSRAQQILFPEVLDEYLAEENPARFSAAFGDRLDLEARGFRRPRPAATGRPPDAPGALRTLYISGYMNRLRSRRRLEREAYRTVARLWLLRKLHPDFNTSADFRTDTAAAFKQVLRAFVLLCTEWGLFGHELVASDGSQFTAVHNRRRNFTTTKRHKTRAELASKIEWYMHALDKTDAAEASVPQLTAEALQEKIRPLRDRKTHYEGLLQEMDSTGQSQVSVTDPDRRARPTSPTVDVGDTTQVAVAAKHHLCVEQEVTTAVTDVEQRCGLAIPAKEALGVEQLTVVADRGYSPGEAIETCEEAGSEPSVAKPFTAAKRQLGCCGKEPFTSEPAPDGYRCPAGQALTCRCVTVELVRTIRY
jgi:transposase